MRTLGAVLAGGRSTRFGSDKAEALLQGRPLLVHALESLRRHCADVIVVGRATPHAEHVPDWPAPDFGPLGGLAGALRHARAKGYDRLLSVPVDCVTLPPNIMTLLAPGPACLADCPVVGLWRVSILPLLEPRLAHDADRSMRAFAAAAGARLIDADVAIPNINRPDDLAALAAKSLVR